MPDQNSRIHSFFSTGLLEEQRVQALLDKPERKRNRFAVVLFFMLGLVCVLFYLYDAVSAYATVKWPTVIGRVDQSYIRIEKDKGTAYCPILTWTYHVQGASYSGSNYVFCESYAHAQAIVTKYPAGANVVISYSPQDPSISTNEPGKPHLPIFFLIIGVIFIIASIYNI